MLMSNILDEGLASDSSPLDRQKRVFYIFLLLLVIGSCIATFVACIEVESIVVSGPVLSIVGLILFILGKRAGFKNDHYIGWIPAIISLTWLIIINGFSLSPNDCKLIVPISLLGTLVVIVLWSCAIAVRKVEHREKLLQT